MFALGLNNYNNNAVGVTLRNRMHLPKLFNLKYGCLEYN